MGNLGRVQLDGPVGELLLLLALAFPLLGQVLVPWLPAPDASAAARPDRPAVARAPRTGSDARAPAHPGRWTAAAGRPGVRPDRHATDSAASANSRRRSAARLSRISATSARATASDCSVATLASSRVCSASTRARPRRASAASAAARRTSAASTLASSRKAAASASTVPTGRGAAGRSCRDRATVAETNLAISSESTDGVATGRRRTWTSTKPSAISTATASTIRRTSVTRTSYVGAFPRTGRTRMPGRRIADAGSMGYDPICGARPGRTSYGSGKPEQKRHQPRIGRARDVCCACRDSPVTLRVRMGARRVKPTGPSPRAKDGIPHSVERGVVAL